MIRAVLDTNVLVSAFLFGGVPLGILDLAEAGAIEVYTSENALAELLDVLSRPEFEKRLKTLRVSARVMADFYKSVSILVAPSEPPGICPDPDDDEFIGIALAAEANVIVSGDRHLLACSPSSPIPVVTISEFMVLFQRVSADER